MIPAMTMTNAPGGTADLCFRAAERRDEEAGDDGAIDSGLRGNAGGDGEGHRERQRDEAHRYARDHIR